MGVNSLPKTVTRQRRDCDLNPGPSAPESSTLTTRLISNKTISQQTSLRRRACTCAVVDLFVCNFESGLCGVLFDPLRAAPGEPSSLRPHGPVQLDSCLRVRHVQRPLHWADIRPGRVTMVPTTGQQSPRRRSPGKVRSSVFS